MNWFSRLFGRNKADEFDEYPENAGGLIVQAADPRRKARASDLPRFSGMANEQDEAFASSVEHQAMRRRLGRAFPLSQPISDLRQFAGRRDLLETVIRSIEERRLHVVLYGDRGIGKTSLLHIVALLAQEARYIVRYTSCSASSDFDSTFRAIASDVSLLYHGKADPNSPRVEEGQTLADLLPVEPLSPGSLSQVLEGLSGTRLLIVLDEFDRTESADFRRETAELIKNLSDRGSRVQILIGGVAENLSELIRHIPSIRRNLLGIPVGRMQSAEIEEILRNGENACGIRFDAAGRALLLEAANGSPYLANLVAYQAANRSVDRGSQLVLASDVRSGIAQVADELALRLDETAIEQQDVLNRALKQDDLKAVSRYALDHFGHVPLKLFPALAAALRSVSREVDWVDEDGDFRFCDDSIPLIIWLATAPSEVSANNLVA